MASGEQAHGTAPSGCVQKLIARRWPASSIGESSNDEPKRNQTLVEREINMAEAQGRATLAYQKWSETMITFDRSDHASHIQPLGQFPLNISIIISRTRLTKVLMDGGSGLKILYVWTYNALGFPRAMIRPTSAPVYGVVPGIRASPLRQVALPITFGG